MAHARDDLRARLNGIREKITTTAQRCGRAPEEITLIAVSKTHPAEPVKMALSLGVTDLGESRVQEAEDKIVELGRESARWHLIGHLQANKARRAVKLFDVIHSLDSVALAQRLDRSCEEEGRAELPVLIQIDLAGEETKTGLDPAELSALVESVEASARLRLIGLMTLPPFFEDAEQSRPFFKRLRELRDELEKKRLFVGKRGELSMGMTNDFEVAIEEGATMVRIGTAIFGPRSARTQ